MASIFLGLREIGSRAGNPPKADKWRGKSATRTADKYLDSRLRGNDGNGIGPRTNLFRKVDEMDGMDSFWVPDSGSIAARVEDLRCATTGNIR